MTQHRQPGPALSRAPRIRPVRRSRTSLRRHLLTFSGVTLVIAMALVVGTQATRWGAPDAAVHLNVATDPVAPSSSSSSAAAGADVSATGKGASSTTSGAKPVVPKPAASSSSTSTATPVRAAGSVAPLSLNGPTKFGVTVWPVNGEGYTAAYQRSARTYGNLGVTRVFYPGLPSPWPGPAGLTGKSVVVSFRASPDAVAAGTYDRQLGSWFNNAPTDRTVFWSYSHEPEDNVARGEFSAASYRAAWKHLRVLADRANNPNLKATLILMCWTTGKSGRTPSDFYAGPSVIDVVAFDCYNWAGRKGYYADPAEIYSNGIAWAKSIGKPFGIAETGSIKIAGDSAGTKRGAWLRSVGTYLDAHNALFAAYFDVKLATDYRLVDDPSQNAWAAVCSA